MKTTMVFETAKTLEKGIENMMFGAKKDYYDWTTNNGQKDLTGYSKEQMDNWDKMIKITNGKKYIKIVRDRGVFAFVMKEDSGKFKKGDILKPSSFRAPALNSGRGNVLTGQYAIQWTGPLYKK